MHTSGIEDFDNANPFYTEEIHALIEQLGECIIDEVLFRVNQELGKLEGAEASEATYDASQLLGGDIPRPAEGYTLQDPARYDDSLPKTLLQVTELPKKDDSTTNVDAVFGPSPWMQEHESGKGQKSINKQSSTARLIFEAPAERVETDESSELFLLKELLKKKNKPLVFEPAPKRKKEEKKTSERKFSSPSEFDLDPVKLIRMKPGGSVNR